MQTNIKNIICLFFIVSGLFTELTFAQESTHSGKGSMVMFITQSDAMIAGHALHIANEMVREKRNVRVMLIGEAGAIALKGSSTIRSALNGQPLQSSLAHLVKNGGKVYITPPTLGAYNASTEDLIKGVSLPLNPTEFHHFMFAPETKLVVF